MFAKLGLTSPFNKRKIKEIQAPKQSLPLPQQHASSIPMPKRIPVSSGLPVYQAASCQSDHSNQPNRLVKSNNLCISNETTNPRSSNISNSTIYSSSNSSFSTNNNSSNSNIRTQNKSRSTSPDNRVSCESNSLMSSDSAHSSQMRQQHINAIGNNNTNNNNTKLPQFSSNNNNQQFQTNNNNKDNKRKSALPKGASIQKNQSNIQSPQTSQTNMGLISNITLLNNVTLSTSSASTSTITATTVTQVKPVSKLQPPTQVSSSSPAQVTALTNEVQQIHLNSNTSIDSSKLTNKKFGLSIQQSNLNSTNSSPLRTSSNIMNTNLSSQLSSGQNITNLTSNNNQQIIQPQQQLKSVQSLKKPSLTFGLPKLTKLTSISNSNTTTTNNSDTMSLNPIGSPIINTKQMANPTVSASQSTGVSPQISVSSKIPSIGATKPTTQLKSPSIQINSALKPSPALTNPGDSLKQNSSSSSSKSVPHTSNLASLSFSPNTKTTAITTPIVHRKASNSQSTPTRSALKPSTPSSSSFNENDKETKSVSFTRSPPPITTTNQQRFKDDIQAIKQTTLNDSKTDLNKFDKKNSNIISKINVDNNALNRKGFEELHLVENDNNDDDDDADDKLLDLDDENINLVDENDEEFQKFLNSDQIESSNLNQSNCQLPRPLKRISSNSNDLLISLVTENKPLTTVASPGSSFSLSLSPKQFSNSSAISRLNMSPQHLSPSNASQNQQQLPSPPLLPPPPPNPSSSNNTHNLLLLTPSMQSSNLLLKTTTSSATAAAAAINQTNLNTFGRSNTLDRKIKPSSSQPPTSQLMLNLNSNNKQQNEINLSTIYSNSLERSYSQRQYLQSTGYSQSPQHRNSLSISLRSPTASSKISHLPCHEPILENGNYLVCNSASTNDIISNTGNMQQLKIDLENARNRIITLTNQLSTNGQIVNTLEQSLSSLTLKLQKFSISTQKKDNLIIELKAYIEYLHTKYSKVFDSSDKQAFPLNSILNRQNSNESINSLNSMFSQRSCLTNNTQTSASTNNNNNTSNLSNEVDSKGVPLTPKKRSSWLRSSFKKAFNRKSSCSADTSTCKAISSPDTVANSNKKCLSDVDENDLNKQRFSDFEDNFKSNYMNSMCLNGGDFSLPSSPIHQQMTSKKSQIQNPIQSPSHMSMGTSDAELEEYQRLLRDKEIKLTDVRLEALATAHQLDQTKEENLKMRIEIEQLKAENIRMQQFMNSFQNQFNSSTCIHTSQSSASSTSSQQQQVSSSLSSPSPSSSISSSSHNSKINLSLSNSTHHVDISTNSSSNCSIMASELVKLNNYGNNNNNGTSGVNEEKIKTSSSTCNIIDSININDGKRVVVSIYLGDSDLTLIDVEEESFVSKQILIGSIGISTKTKWDVLDSMVKNLFRDYLDKLQSEELASLGLSLDSLNTYYVGEMPRAACESSEASQKLPDLLPYGYLVGNHTKIIIQLKDAHQNNSIDSLCFDTLVPKNVMQRYVSLIMDHKNLLFCGPNGTSKSYMARKIGEYLVKRHNKDIETSIAYFNAENKTCKDLKQYLCNIIDQVKLISSDCNKNRNSSCSNSGGSEVPCVLILDNLNNIGNMSEAFLEFFSPKNSHKKCSYVIGTVNQSDVTSLNLHKNFKWVLCVNHTEPVKNYLYRYLVRRLVDHEIKYQIRSSDLEKITKWMPRLWQHVNKYIELYNSADLTLGPKMFSTFPMDFDQSMSWFIDLWNSHLVPYIIETVKEGLQVYGTKNSWEDPKRWILETIPWLHDTSLLNSLYSIEAERVGMTSTIDQETKKLNRKSQLSQPDDDYNLDDEFPVLDNSNEIAKTFHVQSNLNENDKLLNMLMRLQEATLVNQQPKRSGLLPPTESNCFNSNEMNTKQSASVETTLI